MEEKFENKAPNRAEEPPKAPAPVPAEEQAPAPVEAQEQEAINERAERVKKRALSPQLKIYEHFKTYNYDADITEHRKYVREVLLINPYDTYIGLRNRLEVGGADTDFPEFKGVIGYLTKSIFQSEITAFLEQPQYKVLIDQLVNKLLGIQIEGRFNYPYRASIYIMESMLELIDLYYRTAKNDGSIGPYYHVFRYHSYMTTFTDSKYGIPNNIIFPSFVSLGSMDFIKIRCVPILFMGITNKPVHADQYINTPLDFWAHDIQHSKRQIQETLRYFDEFIKHNRYYTRRTLFDVKDELTFYKYMQDFTQNVILPIITLLEGDSEETIAHKAIIKIIIFEIVHEKAWPITHKSICKITTMRYDEFPVENIDLIDDKIQTFHYLFADPTTIGNVVGKLRHGFYDNISAINEKIVPKKYRTSSNVAIAAKKLVSSIKCSKIPSDEYFLALATDRHAMQEFADVPGINVENDPARIIPYPDEPDNMFDDSILYPTFHPVASMENLAKQNSLHKLRVVESNSEWVEGRPNKVGGKKKTRRNNKYKNKTKKNKNKKRNKI